MRPTGFKLDTLLKLADVKGTDRKTSLLHFVLVQLIKENEGIKSLSKEMADAKTAANLQVGILGVKFSYHHDRTLGSWPSVIIVMVMIAIMMRMLYK